MAMVFHCPRVVTLDLHKAQKIGVGDEIIGVLLYTSKKRWRNRGNESTPLSFLREMNDCVGKSSGVLGWGSFFIGKLLVPLGWYPSCLTLQGALQKGIYPINTHCIRCIWGWLSRVPSQGYHQFPYDFWEGYEIDTPHHWKVGCKGFGTWAHEALLNMAGWWFQICFIFTPTWGNDPFWLIFFRWVETTN